MILILASNKMKQAGFAVPHSSLTIGLVGLGLGLGLGWVWVVVGLELGLGLGWSWAGFGSGSTVGSPKKFGSGKYFWSQK